MTGPRDPTPPFGLTVGDRIALERRIDRLQASMNRHMEDRDIANETFYRTRIVPLEQQVAKNVRVFWLLLGMTITMLAIVIYSHVVP